VDELRPSQRPGSVAAPGTEKGMFVEASPEYGVDECVCVVGG
jgi:hypothetical protein